MSQKQVLILIHGMGNHTADSFQAEVVNASNRALKRYQTYANVKFEQEVFLYSIGYNHLFEKLRQNFAESGKNLKEFISTRLGNDKLPGFIDDLADIQANVADNKFIYTHVLDVVFYLTLLGELVRLYVAQKLVEIIQKHNNSTKDIHILSHSLGTAVMHDTLHKLYSEGFEDGTRLDIDKQPINTLWTFANVSKIITQLSGFTKPLQSVVKPGNGGCVTGFYNIFHRFDPFVLAHISRFDPNDDNSWIDHGTYQNFYSYYETKKVSRKNTHSIESYIEDPLVCHDFFNTLFDFNPSASEKTAGDALYKNIEEEYKKIETFTKSVQSLDDLKGLIKLMIAYKCYLGDLDF